MDRASCESSPLHDDAEMVKVILVTQANQHGWDHREVFKLP